MDGLDQAEKEDFAATVIQTRWREYRAAIEAEEAAMGAAAGVDDDDEAEVVEKELTEEEERELLKGKIQQLAEQCRQVRDQNLSQQRILAKMFEEKRKQEGGAAPADASTLPVDADSRYWELVAKLRNDGLAAKGRRAEGESALSQYKQKNEATVVEALEMERAFRDTVKEYAGKAVFPRNKQGIPKKRLVQFDGEEEAAYKEIHRCRVQYIKLRNKAERLTKELKKRESQHDGMHLIDFEQLKIENTNLNEKIEERNEDLLKLRKKATTTIHVLTHVKEKLEFVKGENAGLEREVNERDAQLASLRDDLAKAKKQRDTYVHENVKMKEKMPMIGSEDLLLDYELRKSEIETLRGEVVALTNKHHELMQWISSHQAPLQKLQKTAGLST